MFRAHEGEAVTDRVSWTQPVCSTCFAAIEVGRGNVPREPSRVTTNLEEPCLICGGYNDGIYTRVDPNIAGVFANARREEV